MYNKPRILYFIKVPPPLTGAALMNMQVLDSQLLRSRFDVDAIAVSYKSRIKRKFYELGTQFFKILAAYVRIIVRKYSHNPKLVYFQISPLGTAFLRDLTFVALFKLLRIKIVLHLHGKGIDDHAGKSPSRRLLYAWAFKNTHVICLSNLLTSDIRKVYAGKPYIVNNGIPVVDFVKPISMAKGTFHVLFLSNLIVSKGIYIFLDILRILSGYSGINFTASVVGQEADLSGADLEQAIRERGIAHSVSYLGPKFDNEKFMAIAHAHVLVFPTLNDVWGSVILEAMQLGVPVVASREGAIPEIIDDGINGFVVDKGCPELFAEKVILLYNNPGLRQEMSMNARAKFFERYTVSKFEENLAAVFTDVLEHCKK